MVDRSSSAAVAGGAQAVRPEEEEAPAFQQHRPRSASGRRLSSDSSTGSFTAISMEEEGLLGARHEEAALQSHTPPQHPHPLRSAASAGERDHSSASFAGQGRSSSSSSSAQAAWAKASSFSNPAYVADFTAIPPLTDSADTPRTHLPLPPTVKPAGVPEHSSKAASRHAPSANAEATHKDEQQAPPGSSAHNPTHMSGSMQDHGEELPVDRCIVSGDSFYSGDLMSSNGVSLQRGARVTQRASDGAVVLELPGARQLLLVHDEQEGGGLAGTRFLPARDAAPVGGALNGCSGEGAATRHGVARKANQPVEGPRPIIQVMRAEMGEFGVRTAKSVLLVGLGAGYVSSFARLMMDIEKGTSPRPGSLMGHCIMDSSTVVASMLSGVVAGPIVASAYLARLALRPALLAGAVHAGVRWVRRHRNGAAALLKMLSSGDLLRRIEALKGIAKRAANSPAFRREFGLLSGVELVLAVLADALAGAQAAINAATQEQAADDATSDATGPVPMGGGRARVKQPRGLRARGAAAAAKTNSTAAAAAAAVRGGRTAEGNMHGGACIVGADGNSVPVLGLSGPLPMLATQALRELLRSPEHTVAPLVRAGGVTLLVHAAAASMYTASPSATAGGTSSEGATAAGGAGMLHTTSHAPLAVAVMQVLEAVASAPLSEVNTPLPTNAAGAASALTKGDKEEAAAKEGFAHAVATARMQLASDPMSVRLLVNIVRGHMATAAHESQLLLQAVGGTTREEQHAALSKHFAAAWPAVRLLHAVALEPVGKAMLGEAQGVHALVEVLCAAPTGSKIMSAAAAALHTAVRGSVANSTLLSSMDLAPPAFLTQPNTKPFALPVGGLYAAAASVAGDEAQSTLRAHMHHALAHVSRVMSNVGAAGCDSGSRGGRRISSGSTASNASSGTNSPSLNSAVAGPCMDVRAGSTEEGQTDVNTAAGLSADLCALLCVMDRYHQHAVDAAAQRKEAQ